MHKNEIINGIDQSRLNSVYVHCITMAIPVVEFHVRGYKIYETCLNMKCSKGFFDFILKWNDGESTKNGPIFLK